MRLFAPLLFPHRAQSPPHVLPVAPQPGPPTTNGAPTLPALTSGALLTVPALLTRSGQPAGAVAFGTWPGAAYYADNASYDLAVWTPAVRAAFEAGFRHFDCAHVYGNEAFVGDALNALPSARENIFVASKLWATQWADPEAACRACLAKLQTSYLDCYYVHAPIPDASCARPLHQLWRDMEALVDAGLVRSLAVSNFPGALLHDLLQ